MLTLEEQVQNALKDYDTEPAEIDMVVALMTIIQHNYCAKTSDDFKAMCVELAYSNHTTYKGKYHASK